MYGTNDGAKRYLVFNVPFSHPPKEEVMVPQGGRVVLTHTHSQPPGPVGHVLGAYFI